MKIILQIFLILLFFLLNNSIQAQDSWEYLKGPYGGSVTSMGVDSAGKVYLGTNNTGVFQSDDEGASWHQFNDGLPVCTPVSFITAPNGDILTGGRNSGIFKLKSGSSQWLSCFSPAGYTNPNTLFLNNNGDILSGGALGIIRTKDNGDSWDTLTKSVKSVTSIAAWGSELYCSSDSSGIFISLDYGLSWTLTDTSMKKERVKAILIDKRGTLYAGSGANHGIFRSKDKGATWELIITDLYDKTIKTLFLSPDGTIYTGTAIWTYFTTDSGDSWQQIDKKNGIVNVNGIVRDTNGNIYIGANEMGAYKTSDNGATCTQINEGFDNQSVYSCLEDSRGYLYATTVSNNVFASNDSGQNWNWILKNRFANYPIIESNDGTVYIIISGWGIYRSTTSGIDWDFVNNKATTKAVCLATDNSEKLYIGTVALGIVYSANKGDSLVFADTTIKKITSILVLSNNNPYISAFDSCIYKSIDYGDHWQKVYTFGSGIKIRKFIKNKYDKMLVITDSGKCFISSDKAQTWSNVPFPIKITGAVYNDDGLIFLTTDSNGVFIINEDGSKTIIMNSGLKNMKFNNIALSPDRHLYLATARGIYRSSQKTGVDDNETSKPIRKFEITPNPVNQFIGVYLNLPCKEDIKISIINQLGVEQVILTNSIMEAGEHNLQYTLENIQLPTGVYYILFQSGKYTEARKIILLR